MRCGRCSRPAGASSTRPARCCATRTTARSRPSSRAPPTRARCRPCRTGSGAPAARAGRTSPAAAAWTGSSTRCSRSADDAAFAAAVPTMRTMRALPLVLAGLLAAACGGEGAPPRADIVRATLVADPAPVLDAQLDLLFSRTMLDALEQGVPLELDLALTGRDAGASLTERRTLRLRYLPLARRWQL